MQRVWTLLGALALSAFATCPTKAAGQTVLPDLEAGAGMDRVGPGAAASVGWLRPAIDIVGNGFTARMHAGLMASPEQREGFDLSLAVEGAGPTLGCARTSLGVDADTRRFPVGGFARRAAVNVEARCPTGRQGEWWLAADVGRFATADLSRGSGRVEGGRRFRFGRFDTHLEIAGVLMGGRSAITRDSLVADTVVARIMERAAEPGRQYVEAVGGLEWAGQRFGFLVSAGTRIGPIAGSYRGWVAAETSYRVHDGIQVVGRLGLTPGEPALDLHPTRLGSISLRWTGSRTPPADAPPVLPPAAVAFAVTRLTEGVYVFSLPLPAGGDLVEIAGDFSDWEPVALRPAGNGRTETLLRLRPGTYRVNIRVNGGPWIVPPGMPSLADEFGGAVGLLTLP